MQARTWSKTPKRSRWRRAKTGTNARRPKPFIEPDEEEKLHKGMGWKRAAFTMMAEIVGTGVLGLSHAAAKVGGGLALAFLVSFGLASLFSSLLLAAVRREHPKVDSFQACADLLGGERARRLTALCINTSWLFVLPYYLDGVGARTEVAFWWTDTCYATWALLSVVLIGVPAQVRTFEGIIFSQCSVGRVRGHSLIGYRRRTRTRRPERNRRHVGQTGVVVGLGLLRRHLVNDICISRAVHALRNSPEMENAPLGILGRPLPRPAVDC